jgi:hypothetical protein
VSTGFGVWLKNAVAMAKALEFKPKSTPHEKGLV